MRYTLFGLRIKDHLKHPGIWLLYQEFIGYPKTRVAIEDLQQRFKERFRDIGIEVPEDAYLTLVVAVPPTDPRQLELALGRHYDDTEFSESWLKAGTVLSVI